MTHRYSKNETPRPEGFFFDPENCLQIGEIYREHGLKGFCKAHIFSHSDDNLIVGKKYWLVGNQKIRGTLLEMSSVGRYFLLHFESFDSPESVKLWRKAGIWLNKTDLAHQTGETYDFEWTGFEVQDAQGVKIGTVEKIIYTPLKNFLLRDHSGKEIVLPCNAAWIKFIDNKTRQVILDLPEGILDL